MKCCRCGSEYVTVGEEATLAFGLEWECRACGLMMRYRKQRVQGRGWVRDFGLNKYWVGPGVEVWVECPDGCLCILKDGLG